MSFHKHIISSFQCPIDNKTLGQIKQIRLSFEKHFDEPEKEFDSWIEHYRILCKYSDFWQFTPGMFLYRFNELDCKRPVIGYINEFKEEL